jgi:hypothetical protein
MRPCREKAGEPTAGVTRQYLGCAGRVANGIRTVHLSYVREGTGHALIGARQWISREQIEDPVKSLRMGLPLDLEFRTKGQLAIDLAVGAAADGIRPDFYCGDEVYGNCTQLREHFEAEGQAYLRRVPSNFMLTLAAGTKLTCAEAAQSMLGHKRRWEVRSAGAGSKGARWYAWAWLATASVRHHLLIRRHLRTGELAFHYCYVPEGQVLTKTWLSQVRAVRQEIAGPVQGDAVLHPDQHVRAGGGQPLDARGAGEIPVHNPEPPAGEHCRVVFQGLVQSICSASPLSRLPPAAAPDGPLVTARVARVDASLSRSSRSCGYGEESSAVPADPNASRFGRGIGKLSSATRRSSRCPGPRR